MLNGTEKQFDLYWDQESQSIIIINGQGYNASENESSATCGETKSVTSTSVKLVMNGVVKSFASYVIGGHHYLKLRDMAQAFDFDVNWSSETNSVVIDTSKKYSAETNNADDQSSVSSSIYPVSLSGFFDSYADLIRAVPSGKHGDAFLVG